MSGLIVYLLGRDLGAALARVWLSWTAARPQRPPSDTVATPTSGWARCAGCGWGHALEQLGPVVPGGPWFCSTCRGRH